MKSFLYRIQAILPAMSLAALGLCVDGGASIAAQQPPSRIVSATGCVGCSVRIRRAVTIGGPDSPLTGIPHVVVEDAAGNLIVKGGNIDRRPPLVFDRTGRHIGSLGGVGQGPGEVTPVRWLSVDSLGRVEVYSANRVSLFSPRQEFLRTWQLRRFDPFPNDVVKLGAGRTVELSNIYSPGPDLNPLTFRSPDGQVLRQLHLTPTLREDERIGRAIARARRGRDELIWLAEKKPASTSRGYSLQLLDTAGRARERLERQVEWWTWRDGPAIFVPAGDTTATPYPALGAIRQDGSGHLLIILRRPRSGWKAVQDEDR